MHIKVIRFEFNVKYDFKKLIFEVFSANNLFADDLIEYDGIKSSLFGDKANYFMTNRNLISLMDLYEDLKN